MSRPRRVVLGTTAIFAGSAASLACLAVSLMVLLGFSLHPAAVLFATVLYGSVPAVALGFCCGAPLAMVLHPVRNQWLHVAAFTGLGAVIGSALAALTRLSTGPDLGFMALAAAVMGLSTAVGRLSVWKLARISDDNVGSVPEPGTVPSDGRIEP